MAKGELSVPGQVAGARTAAEVFRGWVIDQRLVCSLLPTAFEDPSGWGILLADAAHHIANALAESHGADRGEVLGRIHAAFNAEMARPTDTHSGRFVGVRPLSGDEQAVADQAAGFLAASMGPGGRAALERMPALWLAVAAFGMGAVRSLSLPAGLAEVRTVAVALDVYTQVGMSAADAGQLARHVGEQGEAPPIKAMVGEGERAASAWRSAGGDPPPVLGTYLTQMQQMAASRG